MTRDNVSALCEALFAAGQSAAVVAFLTHDQAQRDTIEQARQTSAYWKAEHLAGNKKIEQQAQEITRLREALQLLHDYQNGCPLPSYEEGWNSAMALTEQALKEHQS